MSEDREEAVWIIAGIVVLAAVLLGMTTAAFAHDDAEWIARDGYVSCRSGGALRAMTRSDKRYNPIICGSCCGVNDCIGIPKWAYKETPDGYAAAVGAMGILPGEVIPYAEAAPFSPDGRLWICRVPNTGTRRCVFDGLRGM